MSLKGEPVTLKLKHEMSVPPLGITNHKGLSQFEVAAAQHPAVLLHELAHEVEGTKLQIGDKEMPYLVETRGKYYTKRAPRQSLLKVYAIGLASTCLEDCTEMS